MAILTTFLPGDNGIMIFLGLICLGFTIGVLSGLFGVGGGFFLVPLLNVVFNIPYNPYSAKKYCKFWLNLSLIKGLDEI